MLFLTHMLAQNGSVREYLFAIQALESSYRILVHHFMLEVPHHHDDLL